MMNYWWVNQNQTYKSEVAGGFLWSPKTKSNGHRNQFYDYMMDVQAGDIVFSFCDTKIKAIGSALGTAVSTPKPDFGEVGGQWANEGWLVPVEFIELANPFRPKDYIKKIKHHLPEKYSPLTTVGNGLQSVYLTVVANDLAAVLLELAGPQIQEIFRKLEVLPREPIESFDDEREVTGRTDIGPTTKAQLIQSRRGQGIFKANLRLIEARCRITDIANIRHLIASHIKPWRDCDDREKLDGNNGLLLAPHIDHLFDKGYISFEDTGKILVSPSLDKMTLLKWGVGTIVTVGEFNEKQTKYLEYHRNYVLRY